MKCTFTTYSLTLIDENTALNCRRTSALTEDQGYCFELCPGMWSWYENIRFNQNYKTFNYCVNVGCCGNIFSEYFLIGTNMVHLCIAEFLTCPVYFKMLILFRGHFFDMPNRLRVKARRKLGFGFGMITSDLDASSLQRGISRQDNYFINVTRQKTPSTKRPGVDLGCNCQCTFRQLLSNITLNDYQSVIYHFVTKTKMMYCNFVFLCM